MVLLASLMGHLQGGTALCPKYSQNACQRGGSENLPDLRDSYGDLGTFLLRLDRVPKAPSECLSLLQPSDAGRRQAARTPKGFAEFLSMDDPAQLEAALS